jgi:hypothetical protein
MIRSLECCLKCSNRKSLLSTNSLTEGVANLKKEAKDRVAVFSRLNIDKYSYKKK